MKNLKNKVALVTGGAQGIGEAVVLRLASEGAHCAINYRSDNGKAEAVKEKVEALGVKACIVKADISSKEQIDQMFDEVEEQLGTVDILVNNAGVAPFYPFLDVTEDIWDKTYDTNVRGTFFVSQRAARKMIGQRYGKIINIASTASVVVTSPVIPHYISSKGAIHQLTKALAIELGQYNVNVNAVGPSTVDTPFVGEYLKDENIYKQEVEANPMKRLGTAKQIGDAVAFLASSDAEQINGHLLMVDGGLSVKAAQPQDHMNR
ncbi:SDR family NAD(P)-dependent oxidoreductase [Virgibacillus sp. W0430]|uniref:SDR family NAD(P)-dependent oxidoreductase n=1 Tax=Virgibacillus sp. W0430 TaxID=3391580 RepID=UPI003F4474BB